MQMSRHALIKLQVNVNRRAHGVIYRSPANLGTIERDGKDADGEETIMQ